MHVAVVGATGLVGHVMLRELESGDFAINVDKLIPIASDISTGKHVKFNGEELAVTPLHKDTIPEVDLALFSTGADIARRYAPLFVQKGAVVVDNSNGFRRDEKIPLIVPEINAGEIGESKLIANPNCSTIQLVIALAPLKKYGFKRISAYTYQAVSGAGRVALEQLIQEMNTWCSIQKSNLNEQTNIHSFSCVSPSNYFSNVIPQIGKDVGNNTFVEEDKMNYETRRILGIPKIPVHSTCVRVPVFNGHSMAVSVEFSETPSIEEIYSAMKKFPGLVLCNYVPTPAEVCGKREVFVGRVRFDSDIKNILHIWIVADNLMKGAATNAIQIAEIRLGR